MSDYVRRIVVGVDGSPSADRALDWAIGEASRCGATLHLVAAWLYPMAYGYSFSASVPEVQRESQRVVDDAVARVHAEAPDLTVTGELTQQTPGPALVAAAKDADLLVVGSRGRGGFEGLLMGSVSQYCSRHAACSVVVVR